MMQLNGRGSAMRDSARPDDVPDRATTFPERSRALRVLGALLVCVSTLPQAARTTPAASPDGVEERRYIRLTGNTHPLARPEFDSGPAPGNLRMDRMLLVLRRSAERQQALERFLAEQLDPASPNFHRWLTPRQFGERFGAEPSAIEATASWLVSQGMTVNRVAVGRGVIEFSGTGKQVAAAFGTTIRQYRSGGELHWANDRDP